MQLTKKYLVRPLLNLQAKKVATSWDTKSARMAPEVDVKTSQMEQPRVCVGVDSRNKMENVKVKYCFFLFISTGKRKNEKRTEPQERHIMLAAI